MDIEVGVCPLVTYIYLPRCNTLSSTQHFLKLRDTLESQWYQGLQRVQQKYQFFGQTHIYLAYLFQTYLYIFEILLQ